MKRQAKPIPRDILDIATEQLGNPEPSITFNALFDAALRSFKALAAGQPAPG